MANGDLHEQSLAGASPFLCLRSIASSCINAIYPYARSTATSAMRHRETNYGSETFDLRCLLGATQAEIVIRAGTGRGYCLQLENARKAPPSAKPLQRTGAALDPSDEAADQLFAVAAYARCERGCDSSEASTHITIMVKSLVQSALRLANDKAARIEAILLED